MDFDALPILAICGASGSGKTTLIEQCIPLLCSRGLRVAVAKEGRERSGSDRTGTDGARFFAAGADCLLWGEEEICCRRHPWPGNELREELIALVQHHDLVLVEGSRQTPGPMVWLVGDDGELPGSAAAVIATLPRGEERLPILIAVINAFLARQWLRPPVLGCLLIGGKSSRMGRPKHLLVKEGKTWLERTAATLAAVCDQVVVVGEGEVGECRLPRLPDVPGVVGPLAGLLAALRWHPWATVLASACDLPELSVAALRWLLDQRAPGAWAVIPKVGEYHEPLLALYDVRVRPAIERMARRDIRRLSELVGSEGVKVVTPPQGLHRAWRNVNYPEMI